MKSNTARHSLPSQTPGLHLVAPRAHPPAAHSPLALWHLLSLDAPTVAALWVAFVAWSAGVRVSPVDILAMFLAVWMLYAADRLLDARPLHNSSAASDLEERHRFHYRHRARFLAALTAAALPLTLLLHWFYPSELHLYALLAVFLGVWLLLVHSRPSASHRLPKELAVGIFFPVAIFIPAVAHQPALRAVLVPNALLFAAVCTLNCLFLYAWEHPGNVAHAHLTTRWSVTHLVALASGICLVSSAAPTLTPRSLPPIPHPTAIPLACALSSALLLSLHRNRSRMQALHLRALADLVLVLPLTCIVFLTALLAKLVDRHP